MRKWAFGAWGLSCVLSFTCACTSDGPSASGRQYLPEDGSAPAAGGTAGTVDGSAAGAGNGGASGAAGSLSGGGPGAGGAGGGSGSGSGGAFVGSGGVVGVGGTYVWNGPTPPELAATKLDLLLVVDNSIGMGNQQAVLEKTAADLLRALTSSTTKVTDLHVGVITSSLGSDGASVCAQGEQTDDHGHLLGTRPRAAGLNLANGFVSWSTGGDVTALAASVGGLLGVAGEQGCGFEAPLESLHRFLTDPSPPANITTSPCPSFPSSQCASRTGTDSEILAERAAFLRPDSEVAIVLLTNEDDCSVRDTQQFYYALRDDIVLPKASAACATNPNDPCCRSCASSAPAGCSTAGDCQPPSDSKMDVLNLRCFDQKRRYGLDFLFPVQRYVNALTQTTLCPTNVDLNPASCLDTPVPNPLFGGTRTPSMVHVLGLVGVPWQTIAKQSGAGTLDYRTGAELAAASTWTTIYGDPKASPPVAPTDPLMVGSIAPRTGTTPGTGEALAPPSGGYLQNSVNGHEWTNTSGDDLQYACLFPLVPAKDCASDPSCECAAGDNDQNPICQGGDGAYGPVQRFGKAYPASRHLGLVKGLGAGSTVASICAKNMNDPTQADYAYRPAVEVLLRELAK